MVTGGHRVPGNKPVEARTTRTVQTDNNNNNAIDLENSLFFF